MNKIIIMKTWEEGVGKKMKQEMKKNSSPYRTFHNFKASNCVSRSFLNRMKFVGGRVLGTKLTVGQ